jgi:hypothetical protein
MFIISSGGGDSKIGDCGAIFFCGELVEFSLL